MANMNLAEAKDAKNDEFYTQLPDIQSELAHYSDKFRGKVVFCNCDDPFESNFVKYFLMNFNRLGLKELIATGYKTSSVLGDELGMRGHPYVLRVTETKKYLVGTQTDLDPRGAKYFMDTEANNLMQPLIGNAAVNPDGTPVEETVKVSVLDEDGNPVLDKKGKPKMKSKKRAVYYEAGDFRSDMSVELLKQSDIVVTNPPFSRFRQYISQLMDYKKSFLILCNKNSVHYKEVFPLLRDNLVWLGHYSPVFYKLPDGTLTRQCSGLTRWLTNLDHAERHVLVPIDLGCTYYGHEDMYLKYDNFDAINVDNQNEIPCDYTGIMGVPDGLLDNFCPDQFELIGFGSGKAASSIGVTKNYRGRTDLALTDNGVHKCPYSRILVRYKDTYIQAHPELFGSHGADNDV